MRIGILGPGAIGLLFGGKFSKTNDVIFIDYKKERVEKIKKYGIVIEEENEKISIPIDITEDVKEMKKVDIIMICVKSYSTEDAIKRIRNVIDDNTIILTLQNGLGNIETIAKYVKSDQIIVGVTSEGANRIDDNYVIHSGKGKTFIGEMNSKVTERIKSIKEIFAKNGFETYYTDKIESYLWHKLIINTGINALATIFNIKNGELLRPEILSYVKLVINESEKVAKAKGIKLISTNYFDEVKEVCKNTYENINSMLQDIRNGKKTEIDYINGAIVKEGKKIGIPTPVNEALVNLINSLLTRRAN
jgi:2-dehydropantoate 2-reductase